MADIATGIDLAELQARAQDGMAGYLPATGDGKPDYSDLDISTKEFWAKTSEERDERFRQLRLTEPVSWQRPSRTLSPPPGRPRLLGCGQARRHHAGLQGQRGIHLRPGRALRPAAAPIFLQLSQSFLAMDPPRHRQAPHPGQRRLHPSADQEIEDDVQRAAKEIVDELAADGAGEVDAVTAISERLPVRMFGDLFGLPEDFRAPVAAAAADVVAWADPETLGDREASEVQVEACMILHSYAKRLIDARRDNPTDDLLTSLMNAEVDGAEARRTSRSARSSCSWLSPAPTRPSTRRRSPCGRWRTTRTSSPYLREDYDGRITLAIEEFIRYRRRS